MSKKLIDCEIGDSVYLDCAYGFGAHQAGIVEIEDVDFKTDNKTGVKFKILKEAGGEWYDSRDGTNFSNPYSAYYIEELP